MPGYGLQIDANATRSMDPGLADFMRAGTEANPTIAAESMRRGAARAAATFSEAIGPEVLSATFEPAQRWGCKDILGIMSVDPGGSVVGLVVALREVGGLSRRDRVQWDRLSAHLSAGQRLQRRLLEASQAPDAENDVGDAILRPDGLKGLSRPHSGAFV